jgi:hypothetical protein
MLRRQLTAMAVIVSLCAVPAQAQLALTISGGATVPLGDYDKYASTGWIGTVGLMKPVGEKGLGLGAHLFYGENPHSDIDGDKTALSGVLATVRWRFGDAKKPNVFVIGNVGYMDHSYKSEKFPNLEGSDDGLAYGAGAGIELPKGRMKWYLLARYLTADIENATTSLAPVTVGVSFPLGK